SCWSDLKSTQLQKITCSICLDLLKDPVTIPCGHSYCMNCIRQYWDGDQKKIYSCPQCRETFRRRPALRKSTILAELVDDLKKTGHQVAAADHCYAGPKDVACDVCTGRKRKAVKSCLVCFVNYCEKHLQLHYESPALAKHKLVNPFKKFQRNICSRHNEAMKIFCRTDQQCICYLCTMGEHKGHETVPAAAERRIQDQEKDIRSQQETEVSRVKGLQEKLEQEITELKRKDAELEQLSITEDHTQFLLDYPSLPALGRSKHSSSINIRSLGHFEDVTAAVTELRDKLQDVLRDTWTKISLKIIKVHVLLTEPEPKTRGESLKYSQEITLDPNTANLFLKGKSLLDPLFDSPDNISLSSLNSTGEQNLLIETVGSRKIIMSETVWIFALLKVISPEKTFGVLAKTHYHQTKIKHNSMTQRSE
uniref:Uncharacterized protein n=1 Tax=Poecilia latipinna TaxID=48699 RepID=A0A3B3W1U9_9TELE